MVQTFLLFDTITDEKTVKFMQRDIITSTITWHLGLVGSNNFDEYTSFGPFTLDVMPTKCLLLLERFGSHHIFSLPLRSHVDATM